MKRLLVLAMLLVAVPAAAQTLTLTKSGSDVVLAWTGGSGPYTVIRSDTPEMTTRTITLTGDTSPVTDTGAKVDGARIHFYIVSDPGPTVRITHPLAGFAASAPCYCVTGTSTDAVAVYCNTMLAVGTTSWEACSDGTGVPLAVQADARRPDSIAITASAVDSSGNWAYVTVGGHYSGNITSRIKCRQRPHGM